MIGANQDAKLVIDLKVVEKRGDKGLEIENIDED
jgi:hypothetical protein